MTVWFYDFVQKIDYICIIIRCSDERDLFIHMPDVHYAVAFI